MKIQRRPARLPPAVDPVTLVSTTAHYHVSGQRTERHRRESLHSELVKAQYRPPGHQAFDNPIRRVCAFGLPGKISPIPMLRCRLPGICL
jgi:hypothetical protein